MKSVKILLVSILSISLYSCEKYLDIKTQSQQVFIKTSKDCQALLNDYSTLNLNFPSDGTASDDDHFITDNSYVSSALTQEDRDFYRWQATAQRASATNQWTRTYKKIYVTNLILETLDNLTDNPDKATLDGLRGAALFFRAFSFWQIAQLYSMAYFSNTAEQNLGIPIHLSSDINEVSFRNTIKQTYDRIVADLHEASLLLPNTSQVSSSPSKAAAEAMLARVYLSMGEYSLALSSASSALQIKNQLIDYNTVSRTSNTPFSRFNNEVIFHAVMVGSPLLNSAVTAQNISKVSPVIVASYDINDLRKLIFLKAVAGSPGNFTFTGNYEPTTNGTLFIGLAVDELYLIRAECYARTGNVNSAMDDLNTLLRKRWLTGTYIDIAASSEDDALAKILLERRKELLMRGLRWTDLKRLNNDTRFKIDLTRTVQGTQYTLPANDLRYALLIPKEVIINSPIVQNMR